MNVEDPDPIPVAGDVTNPDEPPSAAIAGEPEFYQPPRLGIIHLLAWTAITGVMLKVDAALRLLEKGTNSVHQVPIVFRAFGFCHLALMAAGIVGLAVLVRARLRREPGRLAPGHWILIAVIFPDLVIYATSVAQYVFARLHDDEDFLHTYWLVILFMAVAEFVRMVVFVLAARRIRERRGWKASFSLLGIVHGGEAVAYAGILVFSINSTDSPWQFYSAWAMARWIAAIAQMLTSLVLGIVAVNDLLRVRRDWLHCLGVGLCIVFSLFSLSYLVLASFLR